MNRALDRERHRKRLGVALFISLAAHVVVLTFLKVHAPPIPERDQERATQLFELADAWEDRPLEVVRLGPTPSITRSSGSTTAGPAAGSARAPTSEPAAAETMVPSVEAKPVLTRPAPELTLEPATEASVASLSFASAQRGVVRRAGARGGAADVGLDFEAASDAARRADGGRNGGGLGGSGGIGVTIIGGAGGDCDTPGVIGVPGITGRAGGIGSLPRTGPGRGLIGRTGGYPSAINRVAPARP